jgi:hypothetical protein
MSTRPNPQILFSFDPGPHLGMAIFADGHLRGSTTITADGEMSELMQLAKVYKYLDELPHREPEGNIIVVEDFRSQIGLSKDGYFTVQLVGFIAGLARVKGHDLYLQLPAVRRPFLDAATARVLRTITDEKVVPSRHERDAIAQGLAWYAKHQPDLLKRIEQEFKDAEHSGG